MHLKIDVKTFDFTFDHLLHLISFIWSVHNYGTFKIVAILFKFLLARLWQAVSFQILERIKFNNSHFFRSVLRIKKIWTFLPFWAYVAIFPIPSFFFLFFIFQIFNNVKYFRFNSHFKSDVGIFYSTAFRILFRLYEVNTWYFQDSSDIF